MSPIHRPKSRLFCSTSANVFTHRSSSFLLLRSFNNHQIINTINFHNTLHVFQYMPYMATNSISNIGNSESINGQLENLSLEGLHPTANTAIWQPQPMQFPHVQPQWTLQASNTHPLAPSTEERDVPTSLPVNQSKPCVLRIFRPHSPLAWQSYLETFSRPFGAKGLAYPAPNGPKDPIFDNVNNTPEHTTANNPPSQPCQPSESLGTGQFKYKEVHALLLYWDESILASAVTVLDLAKVFSKIY